MNKPVPVNPPELRSTIVAASSMPWQRTEFDGIEMKILYQDDEGRSTILFKMAPGAVVPPRVPSPELWLGACGALFSEPLVLAACWLPAQAAATTRIARTTKSFLISTMAS